VARLTWTQRDCVRWLGWMETPGAPARDWRRWL